jgi:hypothetical protein
MMTNLIKNKSLVAPLFEMSFYSRYIKNAGAIKLYNV